MSPPLFQRVLGDEFQSLSPVVKTLHLASGRRRYAGQIEVRRGAHPLARVFSWATRLPPAGQGAVEVEIEADAQQEKWIRRIGGRAMPSRQWQQDGLLCEQLGLARFGFRLAVERGVLVWRVARVSVLGVPLPARWFREVLARESECEGRYRFDVYAAMPLAGLLVHYRGWLDVR